MLFAELKLTGSLCRSNAFGFDHLGRGCERVVWVGGVANVSMLLRYGGCAAVVSPAGKPFATRQHSPALTGITARSAPKVRREQYIRDSTH